MRGLDLQPTLKGRVLHLRPLVPEDFESLYAVSSDPLIWEQHPERTRYQRDVFQRFFQAAVESKGALIAEDALTGETIGSSRFNAFNPAERSIEIGYTFLARKCWGKNYNLEMKRLMLGHVFESVEVVYFYIGENNLRSRKAVEKIGATLIAKFDRQPKEGDKYIATQYALQKKNFVLRELSF